MVKKETKKGNQPFKSKSAFSKAFNEHCESDFTSYNRRKYVERFRNENSLEVAEAEELDVNEFSIKESGYDSEEDKAKILNKLIKKNLEEGQYITVHTQNREHKKLSLYGLAVRIRRALRAKECKKKELKSVSIFRLTDLTWEDKLSKKAQNIMGAE